MRGREGFLLLEGNRKPMAKGEVALYLESKKGDDDILSRVRRELGGDFLLEWLFVELERILEICRDFVLQRNGLSSGEGRRRRREGILENNFQKKGGFLAFSRVVLCVLVEVTK